MLKSHAPRAIDVPVLIITARDAVADRIAGLDAGADDYLVKPFDLDELLARVRALLRRAAAAPAGRARRVDVRPGDARGRGGAPRSICPRANSRCWKR